MAKNVSEVILPSLTTTPYTAYDSTKLTIGPLLATKTGPGATDNFVGPLPIGVARPAEAPGGFVAAYPYVIPSPIVAGKDWVFMGSLASGATKGIILYEYDRNTSTFNYKGTCTITLPTATIHTLRGFRVQRYLHNNGTVSVSGTTVTGVSTTWMTDRVAAGARIGFGSNDPTQITAWYEISPTTAISSDTSLTLSIAAPTFPTGTPYVIEELRAAMLTTNATTTNGGLFVVKGLNYDAITGGSLSVPAATTVDNIRACYWLADASTVTMVGGAGLAPDTQTSTTVHNIYCLNTPSPSTVNVYKYNLRAALTLTAGKDTANSFIFATGNASGLASTVYQNGNGRLVTLGHGPANGVLSLFFATAIRVYRINVSQLSSGATNYIADSMVETPPGSGSSYLLSAFLQSVEYDSTIDRLIIGTTVNTHQYITQYQTNTSPYDHYLGIGTWQLDQSTADSGLTPVANVGTGSGISVYCEGGMLYLCGQHTNTSYNHLYAIPTGAHWTYAYLTGNRVITPALSTANASKLYRAYIKDHRLVGSESLGATTEPFRTFVRTSGISDNSGQWTQIPGNGDLSGIVAGTQIQFMFEFRMMGMTSVGSRLYSVAVIYEDSTTDSHYQASVGKSDLTNKRFAWRHSTAFGGSVPALRVQLFDATTNGSLVDDNTNSPSGTWERSTDGGTTWVAWTNADKSNETTYVRYTPASLGSGIKVRALLTQA